MSAAPKYTSMQLLLDEIMNIQTNDNRGTDTVKRIREIITESNKLITDSKVPGEVVMDARILQTGSEVVNTNIASLEINLTEFNEEKYVTGIRGILEENMSSDEGDPTDEEYIASKWKCLAPMMYHLYRKSEPPVFMLGSLSFDSPPPKQRNKVERIIKKTDEAKTQLTQESLSCMEEKTPEENICEHILRSLATQLRENRKEPVEFLRFIINPDSYWETIQNIFYFSFLVRDGRVEFSHNQQGLPIVGLTSKDPAAVSQSEPVKMNHFSISMSMNEWRTCIEKFKISTSMIKPLKKEREF